MTENRSGWHNSSVYESGRPPSITTEQIRDTVERYLERYPDEINHLARLIDTLNTGVEITSRRQFDGGHVTCGAVVINQDRTLLLIRHKALGRWLLPGGHVEPEDHDLHSAAVRELEEETGISWQPSAGLPESGPTPVDIDLHNIPINPGKAEPAHWHADFRFVFRVQEPNVRIQLAELDGHAWWPVSDAPTVKLAAKINALCSADYPCTGSSSGLLIRDSVVECGASTPEL